MCEKCECRQCRYYHDGECSVVMWSDGQRVRIGPVKAAGSCDLWDECNERQAVMGSEQE